MRESIVVLTRQSSAYGLHILELLLEADARISGIVVQDWGSKQQWKRLQYYGRRHGWAAVFFHKAVEILDARLLAQRTSSARTSLEDRAQNAGVPIYSVPTLNGASTLTRLSALQPDIVLLGGVGIVSKDLVRIARRGVLNAHPGIVPRYRGNYVVRWALLAGDEVGVTVHLVDEGIDTGSVLSVRSISTPKCRSLSDIESYAEKKRAEFLVQDALRFLNGEIVSEAQTSETEYPLYSLMPPRELIRTYQTLWRRYRGA